MLDLDPKKCAQYHCDKHVVKMLLELVQLMYTAHSVLGTSPDLIKYRPFNSRHPTGIWVRYKIENYIYTAQLALALAEEYTYRYHKIHACESHAKWLFENLPTFNKKGKSRGVEGRGLNAGKNSFGKYLYSVRRKKIKLNYFFDFICKKGYKTFSWFIVLLPIILIIIGCYQLKQYYIYLQI